MGALSFSAGDATSEEFSFVRRLSGFLVYISNQKNAQ